MAERQFACFPRVCRHDDAFAFIENVLYYIQVFDGGLVRYLFLLGFLFADSGCKCFGDIGQPVFCKAMLTVILRRRKGNESPVHPCYCITAPPEISILSAAYIHIQYQGNLLGDSHAVRYYRYHAIQL